MPISFPSSPSVNQTYTYEGRVYRWTGAAWAFASTPLADDARWSLFLPPAPTNLTATAGNAQVALSWTAPTVLTQTPITDYVVQFSTNSGSTWTTFSDGTSTATSATVTGLTNGTAYTFRVAAVNGVGTGAYSATVSRTPGVGDALFANVSLLLPFDGSANTFTDFSGSPKAISAFGNATQSDSQSRWGGKSAYFDGSNSYIQASNDAAFNFGSGDWVVEFWMYASAQSLVPIVHQTSLNAAAGWILWNYDGANIAESTRRLTMMLNGTNFVLASPGDCYADNSWTHIAVSRSGSSINMYSGGTRVATGTFSGSINDASTPFQVGGIQMSSWNQNKYYSGYIDDLRITKGSSRGYSGSTIAVPIAAFPTQ